MRMLSGLMSLKANDGKHGYTASGMASSLDEPMDKAKFMNGLDRQNTFRNVEACHIFRESIILDEHSHQITPRKELHDEIEICTVLKRIEKLHHPG